MFKYAVLILAVIFCSAKPNLLINPICVVPAVVAILSPVVTCTSKRNIARNSNIVATTNTVIVKTLAQVTADYTACILTPFSSSSSSFVAATIAAAYSTAPMVIKEITTAPVSYTLCWHSQPL